jgi:hypothetical protein
MSLLNTTRIDGGLESRQAYADEAPPLHLLAPPSFIPLCLCVPHCPSTYTRKTFSWIWGRLARCSQEQECTVLPRAGMYGPHPHLHIRELEYSPGWRLEHPSLVLAVIYLFESRHLPVWACRFGNRPCHIHYWTLLYMLVAAVPTIFKPRLELLVTASALFSLIFVPRESLEEISSSPA